MSDWKYVPRSHEEFLSGKYAEVVSSSGKHEARIWYNNDGSINERSTYSLPYRQKHHLGEYAKNDDEAVSAKARKESKESGGGSSGCCSICKCIWKFFKCSLSVLR